MGVEYYAVNKQNKTFYDLGKGNWYELNHDKECFQDLDYLINEILSEVYSFDDIIRTKEYKQEIIEHITNRVAPALFNLFKNCSKEHIEIIHDCTDEPTLMRCFKYKCIGTRYYEINSAEYNRHLDFENRHLDPSTPIHLYDLEKMRPHFTEERFNEFNYSNISST